MFQVRIHGRGGQGVVTAAELLSIPGIGIATVEKYGHQLYRILNNNP